MGKYAVKIVETLTRVVITEAESYEEAVTKVSDAYDSSEVILDVDDYDEVNYVESETFGTTPIKEEDERVWWYQKIK